MRTNISDRSAGIPGWRAPRECQYDELPVAPNLALQRISFREDFGICRIRGVAPRNLTLAAPAQDHPRLHLQFIQRGECSLVNDCGDQMMTRGQSWQHLTPQGDAAWAFKTDCTISALSIDIGLERIAAWSGKGMQQLKARISAQGSAVLPTDPSMIRIGALMASGLDRPQRRLELEAASLSALANWLALAEQEAQRPIVAPSSLPAMAREMLLSGDSPASVSEIAEELGVPPRQLTRAYLAQYGSSLFQDLLAARLNKAAHLLSQSQMPVKQVAWLVGYRSASSFSDAFRRNFGIAPTEVRAGRVKGRIAS